MDEIIYASATQLARDIRHRKVSSQEVIEAHLRRIEEVNPKLNAMVQLTADSATAQAKKADEALAKGEVVGPLHGVPFTVKDSIENAGVITSGGTTGRAEYVAEKDATVSARMKEAGAILLGHTNVPEFVMAYESANLVYGQTNNPYDLSRTPGGSSGGESALIASGGSPLGLGSDSGGSIRLPAHFAGIAGIKPTSGRVPRTGHYPRFNGLQDSTFQIGPMARFVEDLALSLPIISGPDWVDQAIVPMPLGDPGDVDLTSLRVAFHTDNGIIAPTDDIDRVVRECAKALSDVGIRVEETRPNGIEGANDVAERIGSADGGAELRLELEKAGTAEPSPFISHIFERGAGKAVDAAGLAAALSAWDDFRSSMLSTMETYDAILCPTNAFPAIPHGTSIDEDVSTSFSYTMTHNLTGWPGAVVRAGETADGLPIGVQVVGRPWREDVALALAAHIEGVTGGWQAPNL
jgi:amidase